MPTARTASTGVKPWKRLKALPLLRARSNIDEVADEVLRSVGEGRDGPGLRQLVDLDDRDQGRDDPRTPATGVDAATRLNDAVRHGPCTSRIAPPTG